MRFGVCVDISSIHDAQRIGFDYIEVNASAVSAMSDEEFKRKLEIARTAKIKCECFNILFPGGVALLRGDDIESYLHHTFDRVRMLGGKTVVFGSGACRSHPDGMSFYKAHLRLVEVIRNIGGIADKYGLTVAVEPLNHRESNMLGTLREGAMYVAQVGASNVQLLADCYHMFAENEPWSNIGRVGSLAHAHVAACDGRLYPTISDQHLIEFFAQLRAIGYDNTVSIEGRSDNFEKDAPAALATLRKLSAEA